MPASARWAWFVVVALLVVTPFIVAPESKESFRTIKMLVSGLLGLLSIAVANVGLDAPARVDWRALGRRLTVRALLPLALVVACGVLWTRHPAHFRESAADLAIGVACTIAWSLAFPAALLRRALLWSAGASAGVAILTLDQAFGLVGILDGLHVTAPTDRLAITATLGNPGDVGASLVLPLLVCLHAWPRAQGGWRRAALGGGIALMAAALFATTTLAAVAAIGAGVAALAWFAVKPKTTSPSVRWAAGALALALAAGAVLAVGPVRARVARVVAAARAGDLNTVLTGRLDGWRTAAELTRRSPLTGVGQGGFRAEYADSRLRLMDQGTPFYAEQTQVMFATPHNEFLSVAAETGWPGLLALAWGVWCVAVTTWRMRDGSNRALASAGVIALGLLALAWFPMHVAAVAWPWLVWLAWLDRISKEEQT